MYQADINAGKAFLKKFLANSTSDQGMEWLTQKMNQLASDSAKDKDLFLAFSAAPRFVGKEKLHVTDEDLEQANRIRKGFNPGRWTADQAARTLILLSLPAQDADAYAKKVETLFSTADMGELVALYGSLPLLPYPDKFKERAAEGVRTNMGDVYEAVALENPYSAEFMEEDPWNQLVLKTLFVGKPLYRIYGIDERSNLKLTRMLSDYAHERWAAGRPVSPELWRPVGPFIDESNFKDIQKLLSQPNEVEREAAALACAQSSYGPAKELLEANPELKRKVENGEINWSLIGSKALA